MIRLIPFGDMDDTRKRMVLSWRNHNNVRIWMVHHDIIALDTHLHFIQSLEKRPDKAYFLVQRDEEYLGVIDFNAITHDSAELGIYANPDLHRVGTILMETLLEYAFNTLNLTRLYANVFSDNIRAKHLYEKFDFTETGRITSEGREMICMERTHEHRTP
ncbi:MAG: UDP-4-amino-4,6-dideoxy-N-acetyl-beta-L-altrosamine N-acetyltransferase [Sulfuricurvum sp.]|jgi:UDP-4-amino-4,6-dideoxy-N-acetyl-beta-L-altrosamine N-acetyltransferase|uniref:UDP-4-amino-4, 6-dideoxy-N-acetyl-beta-L-altrosamine N-acetyltransferase n=1 Tax=Sulfuricurvum sp. TaxID=2025608 RepID=UPI0025DC5075|nr:UDP-4-amino-4,6-dideoxy-N-acetyl-beta-L-altrosamine N-acetyltransferase [Sulfuricurvum sp.]MCK9371616.1 UDP-4-amino-4,6-dideoxy-N-acetyl-beta-L-altrosamine N-acetyltransferase [Sulfuricurvum sp.]